MSSHQLTQQILENHKWSSVFGYMILKILSLFLSERSHGRMNPGLSALRTDNAKCLGKFESLQVASDVPARLGLEAAARGRLQAAQAYEHSSLSLNIRLRLGPGLSRGLGGA
jgi:hypothetical protein